MNIENKKQFATILLAVALGLFAALLTSKYVQDNVEKQTKVLARDFKKQNQTLVKQVELTQNELNRVSQEQNALKQSQQQMLARVAQQMNQVKQTNVTRPPVQMDAFSPKVPPGKRAITINIQSLTAVGGLVNPGDFVDIIAKLRIPEDLEDRKSGINEVTSILFQNIQVLAVGVNFKPLGIEPPYAIQQKTKNLIVTLAVSPEEAGLLAFADTNGDLRLALRAPVEEGNKRIQVASWDALADFVEETQGTELQVPRSRAMIEATEKFSPDRDVNVNIDEGPSIQIFRRGQEL